MSHGHVEWSCGECLELLFPLHLFALSNFFQIYYHTCEHSEWTNSNHLMETCLKSTKWHGHSLFFLSLVFSLNKNCDEVQKKPTKNYKKTQYNREPAIALSDV